MDMLLGLDMLKRHQCSIDLNKNVLRIGTTDTETSFLSERELPDCARLSSQSDDDVIGQSVREAEERDLAQALQNSRESAGAIAASGSSSSRGSIPRDPSILILPSDNFGENEVRELVSLGFTREQVIAELRRFRGDKTQATAALFAKALKF